MATRGTRTELAGLPTVAAFAARLQEAVDLHRVHDDLTATVHQALEPAHITVWIAPRN